jgi:hypothetical protein
VPRGYDPEHPAARWLKLKSFTTHGALDDKIVGSKRLLDRLSKDYELMLPLVRWLNDALGYKRARSRV